MMQAADNDENLLANCLARRPGAWEQFVDRFAGLISHVIRHTAHSRSVPLQSADSDDLLADVFFELVSNNFGPLRRYRGQSQLSTYLAVIARRVVVHQLSRRRLAEELGHVRSGAVVEPEVTGDVSRMENAELVQRMLADLPHDDAEVVRQFHLEGRSYREISMGLGVPENSIGPTLTRARERLRLSLNRTL